MVASLQDEQGQLVAGVGLLAGGSLQDLADGPGVGGQAAVWISLLNNCREFVVLADLGVLRHEELHVAALLEVVEHHVEAEVVLGLPRPAEALFLS